MNYNSYPQEYTATITARTSQTMKRVYVNMTLALVVTAFVSLWCAGSEAFLSFISTNRWAKWALLIAEIGIVLGISAGINKLSNTTATLLFYLFAVINGATLVSIFLVYKEASIAKTFFITAGTFGAMSVYGYFTSSDLSRIGNILIMALFGLIIASVVNIFAHSDTLQWIISIAGVVIFVGLTAWDTQQIKRMAEQMPEAGVGRLAVLGALSLYLDFINLFLYLLRFFGSSRD